MQGGTVIHTIIDKADHPVVTASLLGLGGVGTVLHHVDLGVPAALYFTMLLPGAMLNCWSALTKWAVRVMAWLRAHL